MSGGEITEEVVLDADGAPVFRAFDEIARRIKEIQGSVDGIQMKARSAADSFNANLAKSLNDLNKTVATLERLQKTVEKYDPQAIKGRETDVAYQQAGKVQRDEAKKSADYDKALAQVSLNNEKELARQSTILWTESDKQRRRQDVERSRAQRLADQELTKNYLADQRAADAQRLKDQKTFEQNRVKQARDVAQQSVSSADPRDLNRLRDTSAMSLTALRAQRGYGSADDQRTLEQNIALEKEYLRLVDQRIAKQEVAAKADDRLRAGMDVRSGRLDEADLGKQLDLNAAKTRQADIQAAINAQVERSYKLSGDDLVAAERNLKVDEARLVVARQRVRELEQEAAAQARANKPAASSPGMFGGSGIAGVIGRTFAYGAAATAIFGTISAIKDGISSAIEFQDSIAKIGGVAGLTATQEEKLGAAIRDVAANSRYATNEIADATMTLAQAGFSAADIGKSLQNIANLAAASGVSMQEATDVVTSAIGAFQLQTSETGHIADVLSAALNTTKLNIQQVAQGIQYAGQTAYENKIQFDELAATMATMAQAGIKSGSTMGTGLRLLLTELMTPTKKLGDDFKKLGISMQDIDVKTRGLPAVLKTLSEKGFGAADAFAALDKRSAAAYLVLKNNQDVLSKEIVLVNQLGNAAEAAGKASDSLAGEWQRFKNILNEKVADSLSPIAKPLQDMLHSFNEMNSNADIKKMEQDLADLQEKSAEASHTSMEAAKQYEDQYDQQAQALEDYKGALQENLDLVARHKDAIEKSQTAVNEANDAFQATQQSINSENDAIARLIQHQATLKGDTGALAAETASLMSRFQGLAAEVFNTTSSYDNLLAAMQKVRAESIKLGALKASDQANAYSQQARAKIGEANDLGSMVMRSGLYSQLPKEVRDAIQYARTHTNPKNATEQQQLGAATRTVSDFAQDPRNKLNGVQRDRLVGYASDLSGAGVANVSAGDARVSQRSLELLSANGGLVNEFDNLTGKSDAVIKGKLAFALGQAAKFAQSGDMGRSKAWQQLAIMAQTALGSGDPPKVQGSDHKKKGRANHLPERQDRAVDAEALKADQAELAQALKGVGDSGGSGQIGDATTGHIFIGGSRGLTLARLKQNLERISNEKGNGALDQWITDRTQQVQDQLKSLKLSKDSGKGKQIWDDLQREIDAKREETQRAVGEAMAKVLQKMVDAAEKVAKSASDAADHAMNMVNARVSALGRASLAGKVPDYVQQTVERQAAYAKDDRDRAQIGINENLLTGLTKARDFVGAGMDIAGALKLNGVDDPAIKSLTELNLQITELQNGTDELKASFGGEGLLPKGFNAQLQMAIANYKEVNHLTASWSDMISMNLTGALDAANQALTGFFSDIISGNASITQSFAKMVKAIIGYLSQLIAKMIATKLLEAALNMFGGSAPNPAAGNAEVQAAFDAVQPHIYGGLQLPALTGRYITDGVPNRDSVNAKIAKGEFVQRKWAVDNVGVDFMKDLNNRGAAALRDFGPKVVLPPPAHQKMSVYVVSPDQQPQMGPNDVLVTIANDIYRGGPTKQLIKEVAQGG